MKKIQLSRVFVSEQGNIHYDVKGPCDAEVVILCHGTPANSIVWLNVIEALSKNYRVYYLDLPGYGQSDKHARQDVRLRSLARVFAGWVSSLNLVQAPHLIGHDFGAATVMGAHLIEGLKAKSIIVADGVLLSPWGTPFSRHVKKHNDVFASVPGYVHEAMLRAHLNTATVRTLDEDMLLALISAFSGKVNQAAYYRQVQQYDYDYTDWLMERYQYLDIPLTILWGECDNWIPVKYAYQLHQLCKGAELKILPDAGHFSMLDLPNEFNRQIIEALGRQANLVIESQR